MITVFYFLSSICDIVYLSVGSNELQNGGLACIDDRFVIPTDALGSLVLLFYTLVTYSYAFVILYVFYHLPKKSGLVLDLTIGGETLLSTDKSKRELLSASTVLHE